MDKYCKDCIYCRKEGENGHSLICDCGNLAKVETKEGCDCFKTNNPTLSDIAVEVAQAERRYELKQEGLKYDTGKNRMGLVLQGFSNALWEVGRVGTFGCSKYGENSWQNLDNAKSRYLDALCRHLFKHLQGKKVDDESGLLHLSHLAWNALCLLEFELKDDNMCCALKQSLDKVQEDMKVGGILKALKESEEENE